MRIATSLDINLAKCYQVGEAIARERLLDEYARFRERTGVDALSPPSDVVARLGGSPLGDGSRIHPVPLILTASEVEWLSQGMRQRARALQCFFADIAGDSAGFLDTRGGVSGALVHRILAGYGYSRDELRRCWSGRGSSDVCFTYAPDLVRVGVGEWRVLEDNVGCVGGLADSYYCQYEYLDAVGLDPAAYGTSLPDLCAGVRIFLGDVDPRFVRVELGCDGRVDDGRVILESSRRGALLRRLGLQIEDGVEDVEALRIVNFPPARSQFHESFRRGRIALLNSPFSELLGDKCLLPYVEAMVTYYLNECPTLRSLATRVIAGGVNELAALESGVVKRGNGAQGTSVYFLDDPEERDQAFCAVAEAEPMSFVVQEIASPVALPSSLHHARLELRPFAFAVGDHTLHISQTPSARVPRPNCRRANLSQGAQYAAVLGEPSGTGWPRRGHGPPVTLFEV